MPYDPDWVTLTTCTALHEAQSTCARLEGAGIFALYRAPTAAYEPDRLWSAVPGIDVLVPAGMLEEARALLAV